jgi:hypothetical protein
VSTWFLFLGLLVSAAMAQDSLPWQGAIVFDQRVRVDDAPGLSGHPAIHPQTIMDSTWTLFTVWADDRDNNGRFEVFFAASYDTAKSWTANVNLSQGPSQYYVFPWLAAEGNNLYVVWQAWQGNAWHILLTRSSDRGVTWTDPAEPPGITVVNDFNSGINFGPQPKLAVDSRSSPDTTFLYLLWADNATGKIQMKLGRSIDLGTSFTDLGIVDKNPDNVNRNPYIAVDDQGRVHCAWARGTGGTNQDPHPYIGYSRSLDHGVTFLAEDVIVNDNLDGVYRGNPSLTFHPGSGDALISWEDSRRASGNANPDVWFARIPRDSVSASANERVNWWAPDTGAKYDNFKPVIRMGPQGVMVAAWHDNPENASSYGIRMAAYSDSARRFSTSQSLIHTFTGTNSGSFGNNFYPPSLFVQAKVDTSGDTITHFYFVWQDFSEDSVGGNIYSVHGRVVKILGDLDVDNDSLDVVADTMRLRSWLPGNINYPVPYKEFALGAFILANTSTFYNPDTEDGPSLSRIDSLSVTGELTGPSGTVDSIFIPDLPASLAQGQTVVCTLAVFVPPGLRDGTYSGPITITGIDSAGAMIAETFYALIEKLGDLDVDNDSLDVIADTIRVRPRLVSPGPPPSYTEYALGEFILANTSDAYNPDTADGPSRSFIRWTGFDGVLTGPRGTIDSILIPNLPESLAQGQSVACTLAIFVPVDLPDGDYSGPITIFGYDSLYYEIADTVNALVRKLGDLDVDDDSLDVARDTVDLHTQPAGPVYSPYAKAEFMLVNTTQSYNPDTADGPSRSPLYITGYDAYFCSAQDTIDSIYLTNLPDSLGVGQAMECTLALVVPAGTSLDDYAGLVTINAYDTSGYRVRDSFVLGVRGPLPRQSLDSLGVAPIPFKPYQNPEHDAIHFQGLTKGARVIIYDASGQEVWRASETVEGHGEGHVAWDAKVASGIYIYLVVAEDGKSRVGKLSVIR